MDDRDFLSINEQIKKDVQITHPSKIVSFAKIDIDTRDLYTYYFMFENAIMKLHSIDRWNTYKHEEIFHFEYKKTITNYETGEMTQEYAKRRALDLIDKAKKATTYQYQEYAGAHYTTFEHDIDTLKQVSLITIEQMISILPKTEYMEQIELLIEDYKRRLKTAENMIKNWELPDERQRIITKASFYRTFITELERAKASLNVALRFAAIRSKSLARFFKFSRILMAFFLYRCG